MRLVQISPGLGVPVEKMAVERAPMAVDPASRVGGQHVRVELRVDGAAGPIAEGGRDESVFPRVRANAYEDARRARCGSRSSRHTAPAALRRGVTASAKRSRNACPTLLMEIEARPAEERERRKLALEEVEPRRLAWEDAKVRARTRFIEHERGHLLETQVVAWHQAATIRALSRSRSRWH